jgi:hypothetical protein
MADNKTQQFVPIKTIKDGIMYMDDDRIKVVLACSSLNLSLKSQEEQNAIISQFQGFLNTLDFPVQIHVESRRINIQPYLDSLEARQEIITDDLMKNQIIEYRNFIKSFSEKTNIMNKRFFVIIDFDHGEIEADNSSNPLTQFMGKKQQDEIDKIGFEQWRTQLEQRISVVAGGLSGLGLQVNLLNSEELIELFYKIYNPGLENKSVESTS